MDLEVESSGTGRDLVLLHSLLAERTSFARLLPELTDSFRVHVVGLPGYGASVSKNESTIEAYAGRVADLLVKLNLSKPAVLGNGFGGFIAIALAVRHGATLNSLIAAPALAAFPEPAKAPFRALAEKVRAGG